MSGKGDNWRKGTDFKKYRDAPYWKKNQPPSPKKRIVKQKGVDG